MAESLETGFESLGLELYPDEEAWLPSLNAVTVPEAVDPDAVIAHLLDTYDIEIASGLGDLAGDVWRVGCMGHSARPANVSYLLSAMADALEEAGHRVGR
jgi:alanine-glyoxylate transaminase/serine-glyoxylate transaminase/serine-pyruvate transaminase